MANDLRGNANSSVKKKKKNAPAVNISRKKKTSYNFSRWNPQRFVILSTLHVSGRATHRATCCNSVLTKSETRVDGGAWKREQRDARLCASRYFIRRTFPRIHVLKDFKETSASYRMSGCLRQRARFMHRASEAREKEDARENQMSKERKRDEWRGGEQKRETEGEKELNRSARYSNSSVACRLASTT